MRDEDRLFQQHQQLKQELADEIVKERQFVRKSVGPGGIKLSTDEILDRYLEGRDDVNAHRVLIQQQQARWTMAPNEAPIRYLRSMVRYERALKARGGGANAS